MGCGASQPKADAPKQKPAASAKAAAAPSGPTEQPHPDNGLKGSHELVKFLGRGGTGDTYLFKDKVTGEEVAIKLMKRPLPKVIMPNILREIRIQSELGEGHVNVIKAKEALLTESHLALVMEYAACGSLTGFVAERWQGAQQSGLFLQEDEARYFFRQFITAVEYCHKHNVAHRDLKLDNTLMSDDSPPLIKLCDFGFAKEWANDAQMFTHIGTPVYMSPELINSRSGAKGYDGQSVDVWASGVLLIVMLLGTFPFDHIENPDPNTSEAHLEVWLQQVKGSWNEIPHIRNALQNLSKECMDLLNQIFVIDSTKRISLQGIKDHAWYSVPLSEKFKEGEVKILADQANIDKYVNTRQISQSAVAQRNKQLELMIEAAAQRPNPGSTRQQPLVRIDLRESSVLTGDGTDLHTLGEEAEGEEAPAEPMKQAADANGDSGAH
ncbi:hypothetical protein WJX73_005212 [Symbiochloris irregularis]|uniref:Protein kinase domain-containing protein n=1 Tax=Symbiochloris irregularis TaxID=706552 RepID=A0AAW1PDJ5_9CHLO